MANRSEIQDSNWRGKPKPVKAFAALNWQGKIIPNSVRHTRSDVRLAAGECVPIPVLVIFDEESRADIDGFATSCEPADILAKDSASG